MLSRNILHYCHVLLATNYLIVTAVLAQTLPSNQQLNAIKGTIQQFERDQNERLEDGSGPARPDGRSDAGAAQTARRNLKKTTKCFTIRSVSIKGHEPIEEAPKGYDRLIGKCASVNDLSDLLNDLNVSYQQAGWTTSRAYLPQQNLADGTLEIVVIPGRISDFNYGEGKPADQRIVTAFPSKPKQLLNLRDLEQGLENFNRVPSQSAKFKLFPGAQPGQSSVQLDVKQSKLWRVAATVDNTGVETTGYKKAKFNVGLDNILNINDIFSIQASVNLDRDNNLSPRLYPLELDDEKYSESLTASYSFPLGYWSFFVSSDIAHYSFIQDGVNQDYRIHGQSYSIRAGGERMLQRDQTKKVYAFSDLTVKRSRNYISQFEIASQRRELTIGQIGLRGTQYMPGIEWQWSVAGKFGLPVLGAKQPLSSILQREFGFVSSNLQLKTKISNTEWNYQGNFSLQFSADELPGSEQFSVGGRGSVRGFQEDSLYGNTGFFMRNEISSPHFNNDHLKVQAYVGLDIGAIGKIPITVQGDENTSNGITSSRFSQNHLVGTAIGIRGRLFDHINFDVAYARSLSRPKEFTENEDLFYFSLTTKF